LVIDSVAIIDKKSERIIIKQDSKINLLKYINKIPFSDISRIVTERHIHHKGDEDDSFTWTVNLIKIQGDSIKIYETSYKPVAEKLAENIRRITNNKENYWITP